MTRYLIAALLLILGLFAVGFGLRAWLWAAPSERAGVVPVVPPVAAAETKRVLKPKPVIELSALHGKVEVRDSPTGDWHPATVNTRLGDDDALRTDGNSSAVLNIGSGVRVDLSEHSEFALAQITQELSRVRLETGRVATRVEGDEPSLVRLEVRGNDAVTETRQGAFTVSRAGDGNVTVAATAGKVSVQSKQARLELPAGQQSTVAADGVASAPVQIPTSLFLKVAQTARNQLSKRETQLTGTTAPGALVLINGVAAATNQSGQFTTHVSLKEGSNKVLVTAVDALGRTERREVELSVDTRGPKLGSKVIW